ncbi:Nuclear receptor-binding protein 2, partial [Cuculus canorus]
VNQGNMPGIQSTFLAMDTEEGVEVVWNELLFTDKKAFKAHEEKIKTMFEQLVLVDHPNIVKLHKYWLDVKDSKARVRRTPGDGEALEGPGVGWDVPRERWRWWSSSWSSSGRLSGRGIWDPPGSTGKRVRRKRVRRRFVVSTTALPDDLRSPIRIEREELRNLHFFPPEYGPLQDGSTLHSGLLVLLLQMAVLEIQSNGDTRVSEEAIVRARHSLDDPNMREFILSCLTLNPDKRPTANSLLFHRVLFEVHSLKLLAAHCFINNHYLMPENVVEEKIKELDLNMVMAEIRREGQPGVQWRYSEVSFLELDKFLEDVRNGIYPLMNFAVSRPHVLPRALSQPQEDPQKAKTPTPEPFDVETRKV